jgi:hypothetical protein
MVAVVVYGGGVLVLLRQGLPPLESAVVAMLAGMGCAWLLINPPKRDRRISKGVRRKVIERDLTSRGLNWDPAKYHIDHMVPFSRGGDNSPRNLRVIEKRKNLQKGDKLPDIWDFLLGRLPSFLCDNLRRVVPALREKA